MNILTAKYEWISYLPSMNEYLTCQVWMNILPAKYECEVFSCPLSSSLPRILCLEFLPAFSLRFWKKNINSSGKCFSDEIISVWDVTTWTYGEAKSWKWNPVLVATKIVKCRLRVRNVMEHFTVTEFLNVRYGIATNFCQNSA